MIHINDFHVVGPRAGRRLQLPLGGVVVAVLSIVWCTITVGAASQEALPQATSHLHGTVLNTVTHQPIAHALVYSESDRFGTMTNSQGEFEFTAPQTEFGAGGDTNTSRQNGRRYVPSELIVARKPGFVSEDAWTWEQSGNQEATLFLTPEAVIVGHVVLPSSEPPDSIEVEIYRQEVDRGLSQWGELSKTVRSRSDGNFVVAGLQPGTYKLFTREVLDQDPQANGPGSQQFGYAPVYFPNARDFGSAETIVLAAGETFQARLSLVRQPYYPVRIAVHNAVPGGQVEIKVSVQGGHGPGYEPGYDRRTESIVGLLPKGIYKVEAVSYTLEALAEPTPRTLNGTCTLTVPGAEMPVLTLISNPPIPVRVTKEFTNEEAGNPDQNGRDNGSHGNRMVNIIHLNLQNAADVRESNLSLMGGTTTPSATEDTLTLNVFMPVSWLSGKWRSGVLCYLNPAHSDV